MNERKPMLAKVYRWVDKGDEKARYSLYDAFVIPAEGGLSTPLGNDEEFEIYIEEIE